MNEIRNDNPDIQSVRGTNSQKVEHSTDDKLSVPTILARAKRATLLQFFLFIIRST